MPAVPAGPMRLIPLEPVLLVNRPKERRILILRTNPLVVMMTVRPPGDRTTNQATMTDGWLKFAAVLALATCAWAGLRAVGESALTIEPGSNTPIENPFAKQANSPRDETIATRTESAAERNESLPAAAVAGDSEPWSFADVTDLKEDELPDAPGVVGQVVDADESPVYRLPYTGRRPAADEWPPPIPALELPAMQWPAHVAPTEEAPPVEALELPPVAADMSNLPAVEPPSTEILPVPDAPQSEMLDAVESIWSDNPEANVSPSARVVPVMPYTPTVAELSQQLLPSVRQAYGLAQRGALYAAQNEFIQILRRIAQAKDIEEATDEHSQALAAGLRALDEADDFMPPGVQLEAEMNLAVIATSHRTPIRGDRAIESPHEAIALYHRFAEQQLGQSVAGERAGSMALYGLGKIYLRLAHDSDDELRQQRKAMAMFHASLVAGPGNHLAANEVGVLLARGGRPAEAADMFRRAIDLAPTSSSYHNLAMVERKLGQIAQADANARYAELLASRDRAAGAISRSKGIQWVAPQEMDRVASEPPPAGAPPLAPMAAEGQPTQGRTQSARVVLPRGPSGPRVGSRDEVPHDVSTAAKWPQKLIPGAFWR